MPHGLLVDVGGSAVKVTAAGADGAELGVTRRELPVDRPDPFTVEADPRAWWELVEDAIDEAAGLLGGGRVGITVASLRQGYVLIGDDGRERGSIVLNSDRRGRHALDEVEDTIGRAELYEQTGHWSAPELTLPKLVHLVATDPEGWDATAWVLSVHDWVVWRLCGAVVAARSVAGSSQLLDVGSGEWAAPMLARLRVDVDRLPPLYDAGTEVGVTDLGGRMAMVVVGGGDTHVAGLGAGGVEPGTALVVAGSSTPVQRTTERAILDPQRHPWVGPHVRPGTWALEGNAGYPGTVFAWLASLVGVTPAELGTDATGEARPDGTLAVVGTPVWSRETWARRPDNLLLGFGPTTGAGELAAAVLRSHCYAVRGNLDDLARVIGAAATRVVLSGGGATPGFAQLLADVLGTPLHRRDEAAVAATACARLLDGTAASEDPDCEVLHPRDDRRDDDGYERFLRAFERLAVSNEVST